MRPHRLQPQADATILDELVAVLAPHPAGLRRWSVMNAIRKQRQAASRDIPLKMEAEIERTFRQSCTDGRSRTARFRRPPETAGEVWALNPDFTAMDAAERRRLDAAGAPATEYQNQNDNGQDQVHGKIPS